MEVKIDQEDFNRKLNLALEGIKLDLVNALQDMLVQGMDPTGSSSYKSRGLFTGALKSSIAQYSKVVGNTIEIGMLDYAKYLEYGLPHSVDDIDALKEWVRIKIFNGKVSEFRLEKATQNIKEHIEKNGPRPFSFIRPVFHTKLIPIIEKNLKAVFK